MRKKDLIFKVNLSSTPLANHTIFVLATVFIFVLSMFLTVTNIYETRDILAKKKEAYSKMQNLSAEMKVNKQKINRYESNINAIKTKEFIEKCEYINTIVNKRIFSWTKLFNEFEKILPWSVRMTQVNPDIQKGVTKIKLEVAAQNLESFLDLLKNLEKSKVFRNVNVSHEGSKENEMQFSLAMEYKPAVEKIVQPEKTKTKNDKVTVKSKETKNGKT